MRTLLAWLVLFATAASLRAGADTNRVTAEMSAPRKRVFVLPIREDIMPPLVYLVRRGVKEAMEAKADLLVIDMDTAGGRVDTTREIISIIGQFPGDTATFVNTDAFSAGAFIAVATRRIYMTPESVIGAAAPVIMSPGAQGVEKVPDTYEKKMVSAVRAMIRATAEKHGHNVAVVEAMIDKDKGLILTNVTDGATNAVTIAKVGEILTLTASEAEKEYGSPPRKLLSAGTVKDLDALLTAAGHAGAERRVIKATGLEKLGTWLNAISPLLLIIGIVGGYIEFKTPGFGLPGIVGLAAFALYFLGGYAAGLSGLEWLLVFLLGLALVIVEFFVYPGTIFIGVAGAALMLLALIMALVDVYPKTTPGLPSLPSLDKFDLPMTNLLIAAGISAAAIWVLSRFLPKTPLYRAVVSTAVSGARTDAEQAQTKSSLLGAEGVTTSVLRPGGKAQFGERLLDVISQGDMVPRGARVRIIGYSGGEAIVEIVTTEK
jgi:membrane-bound serine protease (ClpP class)